MAFLESLHPLLLLTHLSGVIITLAIVIFTDAYGASWVLGWRRTLSYALLRRLHAFVWTGLIFTMLAGLGMFLPYASFLMSDLAFRIKMLFVLFLVVNAFVIGKHLSVAAKRPFAELPRTEKVLLLASGLVSAGGWIGALTAAQFLPL